MAGWVFGFVHGQTNENKLLKSLNLSATGSYGWYNGVLGMTLQINITVLNAAM